MPGMRLGNRPGRRDVSELRGLSRGLRGPRALRRIGSVALEAAARASKEFPEAAGGRRDFPADDLPGCSVEHDRVRTAAVLVRREPNRRMEELRVFDHEVRARIPDDVDEVLQQLSLVAVDLLDRKSVV